SNNSEIFSLASYNCNSTKLKEFFKAENSSTNFSSKPEVKTVDGTSLTSTILSISLVLAGVGKAFSNFDVKFGETVIVLTSVKDDVKLFRSNCFNSSRNVILLFDICYLNHNLVPYNSSCEL
uniref:Uncharacterized protein n=1 Tax=Glossina palpalis gambiensis TaxID=67801 RepID=A0A1B0BKX6_9MUSC